MSIALDGNSLVPVKLITSQSGTPVTNFGYQDVPVSQLVTGGTGMSQAALQANSAAADIAAMVTDFNALLAKLKAAGLMKSA